MRALILLPLLFLSLSLSAARELTIGEYSEEIRSRVTVKLREALSVHGSTAEVGGVVTYSGNGCFFLQRDADGMKVLSDNALSALPMPGSSVMVSGSPALEGGHVVFRSSEWKRLADEPLPEPRRVGVRELVEGDGRKDNWLRVRVSGRAMGETETGFAIEADGYPVNVVMDRVPEFVKGCDRTHPMLEITGVADLILDQASLLDADRGVIGVRINVVSPDDVVLDADVVYLANCRDRTLALVGSLLIAVLGLAVMVFLVIVFLQRRRLFRSRTIMAERKRMADDIHDTIEQHLVGAGMLLKLNRLKEAQDVLVRAKREIRDIVWGLKNDDMMRLSPAEMLRKLAHEENIKGICRVDTRLEGLPEEMDAAAMRDLSLIVREAIGNAVKHGAAKHVAISSDPLAKGGWQIRIANDGAQFDPASAPGAAEGHFGLEGMRQRALRLGTELSISKRKAGMMLTLEKKQ